MSGTKEKIIVAIARHEQFLRRTARMLDADRNGRSLPEDAQFHTSEPESFDALLRDLIIEVTGQPPKVQDWLSPGSFAYKHQPRGANFETMGWLKAYSHGLQISKRYFETLLALYASELHVGDRITAQVVVGPQASTGDITTIGDVQSYEGSTINMVDLAGELSLLRQALRTEGNIGRA